MQEATDKSNDEERDDEEEKLEDLFIILGESLLCLLQFSCRFQDSNSSGSVV